MSHFNEYDLIVFYRCILKIRRIWLISKLKVMMYTKSLDHRPKFKVYVASECFILETFKFFKFRRIFISQAQLIKKLKKISIGVFVTLSNLRGCLVASSLSQSSKTTSHKDFFVKHLHFLLNLLVFIVFMLKSNKRVRKLNISTRR